MDFLNRLVEEKIRRAQEEGVFDDLPGAGKPLELEQDDSIPEDLRLTYKVLKNSGCLPPEVELRREIFSLRQVLDSVTDADTRRQIIRELNYKQLKVSLHRRGL